MRRTLGIDLGSNSLGWAILDDITGDINDTGVVIFPEGMDLDAKSSLETPAATRRAKRMGRRMKFRRKMRKWHLLSILLKNGMCPITEDEIQQWKENGIFPTRNLAFLEWLKSTDTHNPYCDRNAAADGPVDKMVLGRALYHICQRRGFKSSRKDEVSEDTDESSSKTKRKTKVTNAVETSAEGENKNDTKSDIGKVKGDIAALTNEIEASGAKTLGQYFYRCIEDNLELPMRTRVRGRYTGRIEHYEREFTIIMDAQGIDSNSEIYHQLHKAIFDQRPLRSQAYLVGKCPLEPNYPRAQISHPAFEEYRARAFISNLSFKNKEGEKVALTKADKDLIYTAFLRRSSTMDFKVISDLFKKDDRFRYDGYTFHYYRDKDTVSTCSVRGKLMDAFKGSEYIVQGTDYISEQDEQKVFNALTYFDDTDKLNAWFHKQYSKLTDEAIVKLAKIHPKEGNANYSLKAINLMLPFLREGYNLFEARFFAKLPSIIPNYNEIKVSLLERLLEIRFEYADEKLHGKRGQQVTPLMDRYRLYLRDNYNIDSKHFNQLYWQADDVYNPQVIKTKGILAINAEENSSTNVSTITEHQRLPKVNLGMIRNPMVQRALTTLRRLVNYLNEHGKIDRSDTIRIELARSVNDFATRQAYQNWQKGREKLRADAKSELEKLNIIANDDAIERYLLWKEQEEKCLYTGKTISIADLFAGNMWDIEHTIPRSLSGDDSLANKTICEAQYNRQIKKGQIPHDCPNYEEIEIRLRHWQEKLTALENNYLNQNKRAKQCSDPEAHSKARIKALEIRFERDYWRDKLRRFEVTREKLISRDSELGGFKKRQLVDTGIICTHAVTFLRSMYAETYAVNGTATAFARKAWGIQNEGEVKERNNHTHHAVDAMVIAALTPARFNAICTALKDDGREQRRPCDVCPKPYPNFADKVRLAKETILIKHVLRQTTLRQSSKRNALAKPHTPKNDPNGKPIKFVLSKGDTVRGPLHNDTFYGCIVTPGTTETKKVVRKSLIGPIANAEALIKKIVDPAIQNIVAVAVENLKEQGVKAIEPGMITMASGVPINKVRIYADNAKNAHELRQHAMVSRHDYKTPYYVVSAEGSNFRLALFNENGKLSAKPDNSLVWAQNHKKTNYVPFHEQPGFIGYVKPGCMALTYHAGHPEELESMTPQELSKRLYKVVKFEGKGQITLRFHTEARASTVLSQDIKNQNKGKYGHGFSSIDFENPHPLLYISNSVYSNQVLFEGIHFRMALDGTITFIK